MELHTASQVISLAKELESESASFYKDLSRKYAKDESIFLSFAKENERNTAQINKTYYGAITDAIEGCFTFNINPENYTFDTELAEQASHSAALEKALEIEQKMVKFYLDAAEQSKSLMADVTRTFNLIAGKRGDRKAKLRSLLGKKDNKDGQNG